MRKGTRWHEITFSGNSWQIIHWSCADSNVPFIPQDQYALMQGLFTLSNLMKLYMFLIATKDVSMTTNDTISIVTAHMINCHISAFT